MKNNGFALPALALFLSCTAVTAYGQVVITNSKLNDGSVFVVSENDLFATNLNSVSSTGTFSGFGNNSLSLLSDGLFGAANTDGTASVAPTSGTTITFALDLTAAPFGYDITKLSIYAGWDSGRDGQDYSVSYSTASAPDTFIPLVVVPYFNPEGIPFPNAHTEVELTEEGGDLIDNAAKIRFTFTGNENGATAYREIDATGSASIPEPATSVLLLGTLALGLSRRRKNSR